MSRIIPAHTHTIHHRPSQSTKISKIGRNIGYFKSATPESVIVPTGNRIKLRYTLGQSPVLAVRLHEMFGQLDTPRVAAGRVPVTLHLLGPNYRPVQITGDLKSFWANTCQIPQARLAGRPHRRPAGGEAEAEEVSNEQTRMTNE